MDFEEQADREMSVRNLSRLDTCQKEIAGPMKPRNPARRTYRTTVLVLGCLAMLLAGCSTSRTTTTSRYGGAKMGNSYGYVSTRAPHISSQTDSPPTYRLGAGDAIGSAVFSRYVQTMNDQDAPTLARK
jgi:hypothetical protein